MPIPVLMGKLSKRQILVLALCPVAIAAGATVGVLSSRSGSGPRVNVSSDGGSAPDDGGDAGFAPGDQSIPQPADPSTTATAPASTTITTARPTTTTTAPTTTTGPSTTTTTTAPPTTTTTAPPLPTVTFKAPAEFPAGTDAAAVVAADFNGDHHPDLAVVDDGPATHQVVILTGDGKGAFAAGPTYSTSGPTAIATGDFNGDGHPDLAVLNGGANKISILMGVGDGTFTAKPDVATGVGPLAIVTADFTGDHHADLAVVTGNPAPTVAVHPGLGDGTFGTTVTTSIPGPTAAFAAGDLNGDGKVDLAVGGYDTVYSLIGTGNGQFQTPVPHKAAAPYIRAVGIGDFNHDGRPDIAAVMPDLSSVYDFLGTPSGFAPATGQSIAGATPPGSGSGAAMAVGDITGDHADDIVVSVVTNKNVALLLDNGTSTLTHPVPNLTTSSSAQALTLADVNGDGRLDLIVADSVAGVAVFLAEAS